MHSALQTSDLWNRCETGNGFRSKPLTSSQFASLVGSHACDHMITMVGFTRSKEGYLDETMVQRNHCMCEEKHWLDSQVCTSDLHARAHGFQAGLESKR